MNMTMNIIKITFVLACMLFHLDDCAAQLSKKEMISHYKMVFLDHCTYAFEIDHGFRDEVCTVEEVGVDKLGFLQIDSMSAIVAEQINLDVKIIDEHETGDLVPTRYCVLHYCVNQYESGDTEKLARAFAKRMKNIKPYLYHTY